MEKIGKNGARGKSWVLFVFDRLDCAGTHLALKYYKTLYLVYKVCKVESL